MSFLSPPFAKLGEGEGLYWSIPLFSLFESFVFQFSHLIAFFSDRRRSNVVKEVERLKENREKRRAQQAQILEEQEQLRNKDPGNPNWEFLQMILDYKEELEFNPLQDGDPIANHQITVCIRKRPMSQKEMKKKEVDVVTVPTRDTITIHEPKSKVDLTKYLDNQHFR